MSGTGVGCSRTCFKGKTMKLDYLSTEEKYLVSEVTTDAFGQEFVVTDESSHETYENAQNRIKLLNNSNLDKKFVVNEVF